MTMETNNLAMKKKNIYACPVTGCCILQSSLCQQFAVGSNADPDDACAPGRRKMSFTPQSVGK